MVSFRCTSLTNNTSSQRVSSARADSSISMVSPRRTNQGPPLPWSTQDSSSTPSRSLSSIIDEALSISMEVMLDDCYDNSFETSSSQRKKGE
mmetsp:Transcript_918/g.1457  ORF Transcript_918/g.1457 Transcript_918/m.1457 type:complete len:92 (+) Transcript_918:114-389(+)